jgi:ABC-type branched-subunit amino acid transport system ATPase component
VRGLVRRFGGLVAVNNISFDLRAGEILGLIGPNGSGKSTVMKLIMGIIKPNAGTVLLEGVPIASHRPCGLGDRVPAFTAPAPPDRARAHQACLAARQPVELRSRSDH